MWYFRFCPKLPSQVKSAPKQDGGGLQALPRLQPSDVGVDCNREEKKGLLRVKGGDEVK